MTTRHPRRTLLATLGLAAGAGVLAPAAAGADGPPDRSDPRGRSAGAPSRGPDRAPGRRGMLAQQHRVDRTGGVVATPGEREVVWEQVATTAQTSSAVIDVDPEDPGHPLEGFGPALTHSAAWLLLRMPRRRRLELLRGMFSPTGPLRLTALRIPLGTSDFAPDAGASTYYTFADEQGPADDPLAHFDISRDEETILPVLRDIVEIAGTLSVVISPWSAPAWMKTSGSLIGGHLLDDGATRQTWANYLARSLQAYEQAVPGLTVSAVTVQNEPLHETAQYPCMGMTAEVQAEVIGQLLGELDQRGSSAAVLSYDHNWDRVDYPMAVLDELRATGLDDPGRVGAAFHAYAGTADAVDPLHEAHPEAPLWFTEQSGTQDPAKPYEGDFADGIWWMSNQLFLPALRHHHRGVILFNLVLDQDGGPGPATFTNGTGLFQIEESTGELIPNAELYVMAHHSRFLPPGTPTVASTAPLGLPNVAARRADGSLVVVLHNDAPARAVTVRAGDRVLTAELPGWTLATFVLTEHQRVRGGR
ncbi:glycoside hydrolase family 30 protein [Brachybacterium sp. AOP35-5H-19]|uniref:glycoside hydrolase family 30 protein n=1 Tax=Brachybacterium sp. AOP35-5H-19 TaxID=3457685 RepID=UPI0040335D4D